MRSQNLYVAKEIAKNNIELSKAEKIKKEIADNIKYKLYDDNLILL
jgi:hypothetical protein